MAATWVRYNEGTQIWEKAVNPNSPTTLFNHLPVANPTLPLDIANKQYVDTAVSGVTGFVPYTGATANVNLGAFNLFATKVGVGNVNPLTPLHVGAGTETSAFGAIGVLASFNGSALISARNSTNHVEIAMLADVTATYFGAITNHPLNIRTNNIDRLQVAIDGGFKALFGLSVPNTVGPDTQVGVVNNWTTAGLETATMVNLSPASALTITGIQAPASGQGKILMFINASGQSIVFTVNDVGSLPANRLLLGTSANKVLNLFSTITFWYSGGNWWQIAGTQF